jgi:hypothetical protein
MSVEIEKRGEGFTCHPARAISLTAHKNAVALILVGFACFLTNLFRRFPGVMSWDSKEQYAQAVTGYFDDWHPPIMAWLWSALRLIAGGPGPLFFLHIFLYWFGFGLIALVLHNMNCRKTAWGIFGVALLPPFIRMNVGILKDVGLAVSFLASFAITFWFRVQDKKFRLIPLFIAAILLFYGILVRANGIFAGAPLIIYMVRPGLFGRPVRFLAVSLLIVFLAIPASNFFNHKIIGAVSSDSYHSLEIFDVAGIAYFSGDVSVFEQGNFSNDYIANCYVPMMWDTLDGRDKCNAVWNTPYANQTKMWLEAILHHPLAYAEHRFAHFNSELGFVVPRHHAADPVREAIKYGVPFHVEPFTAKQRAVDYVEVNPFTAPVFAFVLGLVMLTIIYSKNPSLLDQGALCLFLSGLLYASGYLIVGVASDYRYQFWTMLSIFSAFVICMANHARHFCYPNSTDWVRIGILGMTALITLVSQIVEGDALFPKG